MESIQRIKIIKVIFLLIFVVFTSRLYFIQIVKGEHYSEQADAQQHRTSKIPAQRGKIMVKKNAFTDEVVDVATNNTLKVIAIDPLLINYPWYDRSLPLEEQKKGNPELVAQIMAPLLSQSHCEKVEGCDVKVWADMDSIEKEIVKKYEKKLLKKLKQTERTSVLLKQNPLPVEIEQLKELDLPGVMFDEGNLYVDPTRILSPEITTKKLAGILEIPPEEIERKIRRQNLRHVVIEDKVVPLVADQIEAARQDKDLYYPMRGVIIKDEGLRYYPEKNFLSQVIGFVGDQGVGKSGIENEYEEDLQGETGSIIGPTSTRGERILHNSEFQNATDGKDITLTIDRLIQSEIERIMMQDLALYDADFGQAIVVQPDTGKILAMVNVPTFDPNNFQKEFRTEPISVEQDITQRADRKFNQRIKTLESNGELFRYQNLWGDEIFKNRAIFDTYEPGSVMKAVTMAIALDGNEVTPETRYNDTGPVEIDGFHIRNSDDIYAGTTSMTSVLDRSLNTGIVFITIKMGPRFFYQKLQDFGFGKNTGIKFTKGEPKGTLEHWSKWAQSELVTKGYGQGIAVTPLQMIMAFSALANDGILMKPILIEKIENDEGVEIFTPEKVKRVISSKTANEIQTMLKHGVRFGVADEAQVEGYEVMGKTGTSQTYYKGQALEGLGTTIASFAGAGFDNNGDIPFVILVKYDYPKQSQWGSKTAAKSFQRIASFLFEYYEIPSGY